MTYSNTKFDKESNETSPEAVRPKVIEIQGKKDITTDNIIGGIHRVFSEAEVGTKVTRRIFVPSFICRRYTYLLFGQKYGF